MQKTGERGLGSLVDADMWYRDVVTSEILKMGFTYEQLLGLAFSTAFKGSNGLLPIHKALYYAKKGYPEIAGRAADSFERITSKTIRNSRKYVEDYSSPMDLWEREKNDRSRAFRLLNYLPEEKMPVDEIEAILKSVFEEDKDVLLHTSPAAKTDIRRLIRFFDYLKWGKIKDPQI